uniref:Uncharacterized protein n=1 Tax=Romanomermis culicivorax TaxID=13658 RepID=A0A915IT53_ROMCU
MVAQTNQVFTDASSGQAMQTIHKINLYSNFKVLMELVRDVDAADELKNSDGSNPGAFRI